MRTETTRHQTLVSLGEPLPYTGDKKRAYQLEFMRKRRQTWIDENGPCVDCGSADRLEVDHKDASTKKFNPASIWSRRQEIRDEELAKCVVRCYDCHLLKSKVDWIKINRNTGERNKSSVLTKEIADKIRNDYLNEKISIRDLAKRYGVGRSAIHGVVSGKRWN